MSHPLLANDPSVSLTAACQTTDPTLKSRSSCLDQIGTPVMPKVVLGGIGINPTVRAMKTWVGQTLLTTSSTQTKALKELWVRSLGPRG